MITIILIALVFFLIYAWSVIFYQRWIDQRKRRIIKAIFDIDLPEDDGKAQRR